nr:olfactory receptor 6N1-like [Vicugna pacos]
MERASRTLVTEFVFVRFSNSPGVQLLIFSLFLLIHLSSLVGSALIVHIVAVDGRLHTPMYLFICNLSLVELWYTTVTVPKMPASSLNSQGVISGLNHFSQYYFFSLAPTELFILPTMAFDCDTAICQPFLYPLLLSPQTWGSLAGSAGLWDSSGPCFPHSSLHKSPSAAPTRSTDANQAFRLSCTDTYAIQTVGYTSSTVTILEALVFIMASYALILTTIPAMASAAARRKPFYMCTAHHSVVTINFSTLVFTYVHPTVKYASNVHKIVAIFYSVITPLLSPLIYTLRNKDVKEAVKVLVSQI